MLKMIRIAIVITYLLIGDAGAVACVVLGDSIALGVGRVATECTTMAKGGLTSAEILAPMEREQGPAIVSAGTNDRGLENTAENLRAIRSKIEGRAIWILSVRHLERAIIRVVAQEHGDDTVSFVAAPHNLPPQSYADIAENVRNILRTRQ